MSFIFISQQVYWPHQTTPAITPIILSGHQRSKWRRDCLLFYNSLLLTSSPIPAVIANVTTWQSRTEMAQHCWRKLAAGPRRVSSLEGVDLLPANFYQKQEQHGRDPLQDWWPSYKVWLENHLEFIAVTPGATDKLSCSSFWGDRRENLVFKESRRKKKLHQLDIQQPCSEINYTDEAFHLFLCFFEIYMRL